MSAEDFFFQSLLLYLATHGDEYTLDQWEIFQRVIDRHELGKDAAYLEWKAGADYEI